MGSDGVDRTHANPPMPLEWHPWYRDKTWLYDWLKGVHNLNQPIMRIPVTPPLRAKFAESDDVAAEPSSLGIVTLTKNEATGPAPYVGKPFCYVWTVAVDDYGRGIATDSRIHYIEPWKYPGRW